MQVQYVRCLKPNSAKVAVTSLFDSRLIADQLRYAGTVSHLLCVFFPALSSNLWILSFYQRMTTFFTRTRRIAHISASRKPRFSPLKYLKRRCDRGYPCVPCRLPQPPAARRLFAALLHPPALLLPIHHVSSTHTVKHYASQLLL